MGGDVKPLKEMTEATCLYDGEGNLVGKWVPETGRGIFADCFIGRISVRPCYDCVNVGETCQVCSRHYTDLHEADEEREGRDV